MLTWFSLRYPIGRDGRFVWNRWPVCRNLWQLSAGLWKVQSESVEDIYSEIAGERVWEARNYQGAHTSS